MDGERGGDEVSQSLEAELAQARQGCPSSPVSALQTRRLALVLCDAGQGRCTTRQTRNCCAAPTSLLLSVHLLERHHGLLSAFARQWSRSIASYCATRVLRGFRTLRH